ncbi:fumarylacetoacetate hydrolase family protein [Salsuginibacillus kocurii]|uniref:fumarylacetoacetate hydrolase family protein n=1 Tax=Salsuginibacillus kocurii TaxID=427078 RepID=UPI00035C0D2A|nr:fumarylacetoacetate hydrolase family protein [Salsuginibacillus kocurii]
MKIVSFSTPERETFGLYLEETGDYVDASAYIHKASNISDVPETVIDLISMMMDTPALLEEVKTAHSSFRYPADQVNVLAPIPRTRKNIFCIGKNYADHAIEMGSASDIPQAPMVFSKAPTAIIGPDEKIEPHEKATEQLDYEGEIAVVIGKKGRGITKEEAGQYIFGYTLFNDVTARDLQKKHSQFLLGKSLDTFAPLGPWIVPKEFMPEEPLTLTTFVNGEERQQGSTDQLIFDVPTLIETISQAITLEPGDIIATGTPAGVGKAMDPPQFLQPGDKITIEVEGIGRLENIVADS